MKLFMSHSLELCLVLVMGFNSRQQEILGTVSEIFLCTVYAIKELSHAKF
jgi:hypothetical protein